MVAMVGVIDPGELDGVELLNLNAQCTDSAQVTVLQRRIITRIAKAIEHGSHLNAFLGLLAKQLKQSKTDAVVPEVEIFEMNVVLGLSDCGEHRRKLILSGVQEHHAVVVGERDAQFLLKGMTEDRVRRYIVRVLRQCRFPNDRILQFLCQ